MTSFLIVIERAENNYSAYCLDDVACVATGETIDETLRLMQEAILLWIETTLEYGGAIPEPKSLQYHLNSSELELAPDDILTHVTVKMPELA
ncbi:MAG: type II toxin-antitoxin system HicB family antitoxin [Candidatus Kapabacteria bacterium]|nr:type II toxin-antitoxin system HicB family antitoxin [Candidatus Kapabacteria bacterium]